MNDLRNPPAVEVALLGLAVAINSIEEFIHETKPGPCKCGDPRRPTGNSRCRSCEIFSSMADAEHILFNLHMMEAVLSSDHYHLESKAAAFLNHLQNNYGDWPEPEVLAETLGRLAGQELPEDEADLSLCVAAVG